MRAELYWISAALHGRLAIAPRPRGGDWLADELRSWRTAGVDVIVSLLRQEEVAELQLDEERLHCEQLGMRFVSFPVSDRGVPESAEDFLLLISQLEEELGNDRVVAIHCRMGIGRSALLAACLLVRAGDTVTGAFTSIASDRGMPVPDTDEQMLWTNSFAERHRFEAKRIAIRRYFAPLIGSKLIRYETAELLLHDGTWCSWNDLPIRLWTDDGGSVSIAWGQSEDHLWMAADLSLPFSIEGTAIRWVANSLDNVNRILGSSIDAVLLGQVFLESGIDDGIWTRLLICLGRHWLEVFNAGDENGYAIHAIQPAGTFVRCV